MSGRSKEMATDNKYKPRGGNKQHSGVLDLNLQGAEIQRRTSKRASSKDRHGQIYPDGFAEASIRTVTPDVVVNDPLSSASAANSTTTSPTSRRANADTSEVLGNLERLALTHPSESSNRLRSNRDQAPRPRTRTLDERRNQSPSSKGNNRSRMGSLGAGRQLDVVESGESTPSIGYPSIIASSSQPKRLVKSPPRPLSPVLGVPAFPTPSPDPANWESSPTIDTSRILSLMKTTCGRMHGILSFRTSDSGNWTSGYCAINVATGSLIYQMKGNLAQARTLIPDLRGCQVRTQGTKYSPETYLEISNRSFGTSVHLRPLVTETFDTWLAALLCWQPLRPKGAQNKMTKPQPTAVPERASTERRRSSVVSPLKDAAIIKVGKMLYWDHDARVATPQSPTRRISTYKQQRSAAGTAWRKVSATLQENGLFRLYAEADNKELASVPLSSLSRCAIQRLHPSVLDDEYCLAIYPQYTASNCETVLKRPVYLSLEARVVFEVWFVLLRAFAVPELYGPEQSEVQSPVEFMDSASNTALPTDNMFRMERLLSVRIIEAKVHEPREINENHTSHPSRSGTANQRGISGDYHSELLLDGEVRGRTAIKSNTSNPFWREDYTFSDLPPILSSAMVTLKSRNSGQRDWALIADERYESEDADMSTLNHMDIVGEIQISPLDTVLGMVDLNLHDLDRAQDTEKWCSIMNERQQVVGEMLLKLRLDEAVVLMTHDYKPLSELLHQFSTGLTQQIAASFPDADARKIPETLLNIFQVSGNATDWLTSLVEDEIDGLQRESGLSRFRYSQRLASNDSYESNVDRELVMRDMNKNATAEANLLFRGNSLLTKALDAHMRRVGREYLEEVLSEKIRDIDESDPDCEVDPMKVENPEILKRNWRNLVALTENIWKSIASSVNKCPPELRLIFRHIRSCAEDRYGDFKRSVSYSSVSGFLFLRFLCPAVLNPKLFGLLKDHPRPRSHRTLTLIAKSLQTLANYTTFGSKEPWMESMNSFINAHRQEFKNFIDAICSIPADRAVTNVPPSYTTPITILNRLPPTSREGFPSLPFLIDSAREFATLVSVWNEGEEQHASSALPSIERPESAASSSEDIELHAFDALCRALRAKTREALSRAEQAERPSGVLEVKWEELVNMQMQPGKRPPRPKPQRYPSDPMFRNSSAQRRMTTDSAGTTGNNSTVSLDATLSDAPGTQSGSRKSRPPPLASRDVGTPRSTGTTHSSPSEATPPGSGSGVWSEEDRPSQTVSWEQPETIVEHHTPMGDEEREARARRARRLGARSLSGSVRSLTVENGTSSAEQFTRSPNSPRETKWLVDVWGFRRHKNASSSSQGGAPLSSPNAESGDSERETKKGKSKKSSKG